ncbi:hypothetical protein DXG01_017221 [Tephrocybe rancida]|nr:hypothetical protein DXG01_017221 [Tephrocybe rancida]
MRQSNDTPVFALLVTVFNLYLTRHAAQSIFEVFLLCLAGYILASQGVLDKKTQKQINRLNVSLFTPALLFSKVAFFLTPEKLRELWIVPLFFVLVTLVSMAVAFFLSHFAGLKRSQRNFAMAASMFMNSNSLPIALMQSLVVSVPGLQWGDDDNKNSMIGRALTYLVLYSTLGMVVRWSYGVRLLSQADDDAIPDSPRVEPQRFEARLVDIADEHTPLASRPSTSTFVAEPEDYLTDSTQYNADPHSKLAPPKRRTTYYRSFPNSPSQEERPLPPDSSAGSSLTASPANVTPYSASPLGSIDALPLPLPTLPLHGHTPRLHRHKTTMPHRAGRKVKRFVVAVNNFMTAPLWAAVASIFVACVRPVQHMLEIHLLSVSGALAAAGKCSIPLTLIVLGAYFYSPPSTDKTTRKENWWDIKGFFRKKQPVMLPDDGDNDRQEDEGGEDGIIGAAKKGQKEGKEGETKTVAIAVLSRMVITPLLLMPVLIIAAKYDWQQVFDDPVFIVSNVLLVSSPPALTLAQITQAASGDAFERLISRTIFWSYCILTPPATIFYVVVGLLLAKM